MKKPLLILLFLLATYLMPVKQVSAQSFDLSISPPLTHVLIKPDTSVIQAFNIKNHADHPITLTARLVPFAPGDGDGIAELNLDSNPEYLSYFSLANANILLNQPFSIPANGADQLVLMIKFPKNAILADYYTSLVVSQASPDIGKLTGTYLSGAVVANILTTVNLTSTPNLNLSLTDAYLNSSLLKIGDYHLIDTLSPITFHATAQNHSPFLTTTSGSFTLNFKGIDRYTTGFKPLYLLAYSNRQLESSDSADFTYHPNLFNIGLSTATFSLDQNGSVVTQSLKLIFFPVKIILGLLLALSLLAFIFTKRSS